VLVVGVGVGAEGDAAGVVGAGALGVARGDGLVVGGELVAPERSCLTAGLNVGMRVAKPGADGVTSDEDVTMTGKWTTARPVCSAGRSVCGCANTVHATSPTVTPTAAPMTPRMAQVCSCPAVLAGWSLPDADRKDQASSTPPTPNTAGTRTAPRVELIALRSLSAASQNSQPAKWPFSRSA